MTRRSPIALASVLILGTLLAFPPLTVDAKKKWTITERQDEMKKEIKAGVKSGDLTQKEANSLNEQESKIEAKEEKMKGKNAGKLSVDNGNTLERDLNRLKLRIDKLKLEKRVK